MRWLSNLLLAMSRVVSKKQTTFETETPRAGSVKTSLPPFVMVLNRACYQEFSRTYPISSSSELKAVLKNEYPSSRAFHMVEKVSSDSHEVITYLLLEDVIKALPKIAFCIPESALYKHTRLTSDKILHFRSDEQQWFLGVSGNSVKTQLLTSLCSTAADFKLINGIDLQAETVEVSDEFRESLREQGMKSMPIRYWFDFLRFSLPRPDVKELRNLALTFAGLCLLYFSLSVAYLQYQAADRKERLNQLTAEADRVLALDEKYSRTTEYLKALSTLTSADSDVTPIWQLTLLAHQQGVELNAARYQHKTISLQGHAQSATEFLSLVLQQPYVKNAAFSAPSRNVRGREQFELSVVLKNIGDSNEE